MSSTPKPTALLEAVLFASAQPLPPARLRQALGLSEAKLVVLVDHLRADLLSRGLELVDGPDGYELEVAAALRSQVAEILAHEAPALSPAALEVLTIIAYNQPITKMAVDEVRGIASDASLRSLLARELVVAKGKQEGAALYRTTNQFLKVLGLTHINQLPVMPVDSKQESEHATE